jgi:hypothetical protein
MRFHRSDVPGLLIATLGPVGLTLLFLAAFDTWDHHGTPLLGAMAANLAVGGGLLAAFTRFIRNWDVILGLLLALVLSVGTVIGLQQTGDDGTALATTVKWVGVVSFLALNVVVTLQIINNGLIPMLNRIEARRAAESES